MEQELEQLRSLVEDLFSKVERLEERVDELEEGATAKPKGPEPILTCVQCQAEYKESENGEGYCKYHTGVVQYGGFKTKLTCCSRATGQTIGDLLQHPGCTKGKHNSKHHTDFFYTNYLVFMKNLSNNAKEMWAEMDIYDFVAESCLWAEVGKSNEDEIMVIAGCKYANPTACASLKPKEIKKYKKTSTLFEKSDSVGWCQKAELVVSGSSVEGILVSLKTASSKVPYVKKINFAFEGENITLKNVESISDPRPEKPSHDYTVPEEEHIGPELEPGEDYSQGRKNDYPTVTNDDLFPMEMVQQGNTEVDSETRGVRDSTWINMFFATIKITNGSLDIVSINDVLGEYQNEDGDWIKCDKVNVSIKLEDGKKEKFMEDIHFLVDGAAPFRINVRLDINIKEGPIPNGYQECRRAHHALPQPLKLRVTLVDSQKRTASLIIEQGNKPLPLGTKEKRQASWAKKKPVLFYLCADDLNRRKRSDVAIYYNEDRDLCYRPAPNDTGNTYHYLRTKIFETAAYKAKKSGNKEQEITAIRSENKGSKVEAFALVDLEYQYTFALKIVITTPTSSATGYFLIPSMKEVYETTISTAEEIEVYGDLIVEFKVCSVSKNDEIAIYSHLGCKPISREFNRKEITDGSLKMKAPGKPGKYEVRYYPKPLNRGSTPFTHDIYVASAQFNVITA